MKNEMTVWEHLSELRNRIIVVIISFIVSFITSYVFSQEIFDFLLLLGRDIGFTFVYISPAEIITEQIKIAATLGLFIAFPVIIVEILGFINPAVNVSKIKCFFAVVAALILFGAGVLFAYKILIPFVFNFFFETGVKSDIEAQISVQRYADLYISLLSGIGLTFELPLFSLILTRIGIINADLLKKGRRFAVIVCLIVGAILTPPDVFSQLMVAGPMLLLYEISIMVSKIFAKKQTKETVVV